MKLSVVFLFVSILSAQNFLPDPKLTPGVINPLVTQANIQKTICKSGWTKTERPTAKYTDQLKVQQMNERGFNGDPHDFEEDHRVSLEVGGAPSDPANLWPQPWPEARLKDVVETNLKRRVCSGQIPLTKAQEILMGDWTAEYQRITGKSVAEALRQKGKR